MVLTKKSVIHFQLKCEGGLSWVVANSATCGQNLIEGQKKKKIFAKLTLFQIQKINLFRFLLYSPKDNMFTTQTINLQYTLPGV